MSRSRPNFCLAPAGVFGILSLALVLRLYELGSKSVWVDEAYTYFVARGSLRSVWNNLVSDHVPAYFTLMWAVVRVLGDSEWALRLPSAIAGVVTVAGIWAIGRVMGRPIAGLFAAGLGALFPFTVYWSQEAKPEALWMAIATWSYVCLLAAWRFSARRLWAAYLVVSLAGLYTFYLHALVIIAQNAVVVGVLVYRRQGRLLLAWLAGQGALMAAFTPWLVTHLARAAGDVSAWANLEDSQWVGARLSVADFVTLNTNALLGGDPNPAAGLSWLTVLALAGVVLIILGMAIGRSFPGLRGRPSVTDLFLATWIGLPLVANFVLQLILPAYQTRYLLAVVPAILVLLGLGLDRAERRGWWLRTAALAALALAWLGTTAQLYSGERYQHADHREVTAYVVAHRGPDDLFSGDPDWQAIPFWYYLRRTDQAAFLPLSPNTARQQLEMSRAAGAHGIWLAVQLPNAGRLEPIVGELAQATGPDVNFHGIRLRYYEFASAGSS